MPSPNLDEDAKHAEEIGDLEHGGTEAGPEAFLGPIVVVIGLGLYTGGKGQQNVEFARYHVSPQTALAWPAAPMLNSKIHAAHLALEEACDPPPQTRVVQVVEIPCGSILNESTGDAAACPLAAL